MKQSKTLFHFYKMTEFLPFDYDEDFIRNCAQFKKDFDNPNNLRIYNPYSGRKIKKDSSTASDIYDKVKKILLTIDEEEYHSPIKMDLYLIDKVPACLEHPEDENLMVQVEDDRIVENWYEGIDKKLKSMEKKKEIVMLEKDKIKYSYWKYEDLVYHIPDQTLDQVFEKWTMNYPEIYSFLDHYLPEFCECKPIMKHLTMTNFSLESFVNVLPNNCKMFFYRQVDYRNVYENYYPAMILSFMIYRHFMRSCLKFLKLNKIKMNQFLESKNKTTLRINIKHLKSMLFSYFIMHTPIEKLEEAKSANYLDRLMTKALTEIDAKNMCYRFEYRQLITDVLGWKIKRHRYISLSFSDLENFGEIWDFLCDKVKQETKEKEEDDDDE